MCCIHNARTPQLTVTGKLAFCASFIRFIHYSSRRIVSYLSAQNRATSLLRSHGRPRWLHFQVHCSRLYSRLHCGLIDLLLASVSVSVSVHICIPTHLTRVVMSTDTLLHDLYTLFFSYTQSSLYRTGLVSLTTSIRSLLPASLFSTTKQSSSATASSTLFVESRLQREFGFYSLSASNANSLSHTALVQLSFVLFVVFLIVIPCFSLLCLSLSFTSSLLVYLTGLSTAYVTISTVVYSLVLLQSLVREGSGSGVQFPLALSSLVYLYFLNVLSFTVVYFTMVQTYDAAPLLQRKGGGGSVVLEGVSGADGMINIVHCFYFSISTFTTVGFGDIHGQLSLQLPTYCRSQPLPLVQLLSM